jgi:lysine 6-dehydrogenase
MRIAVVGAAGAMARVTLADLLEFQGAVEITAIDRRPIAHPDPRVRAVAADVRDVGAMARLLAGHDAVLNCVTYYLNLEVMRAALAARVPYSDLGGLYHGTLRQFELDAEFAAAGVPALLGMGSTPGITNAMAGEIARTLDTVDEVHVRVGCVDEGASGPLPVPYALDTLLDEFVLPPMIVEDGIARAVEPMSGFETLEFPAPVGRVEAMYTLHSEVAMFPRSWPGLAAASFKVAFGRELYEKTRFLVELGFAGREARVRDVAPREMLLALAGAQAVPDGAPRDADGLRVIVRGRREGRRVERIGECIAKPRAGLPFSAGALDTGVPLAIAGQLLAERAIAGDGVLCPELALPHRRFFSELARRGLDVRFEESPS